MAVQTNLEKTGFEKRRELEVRNDYNKNEEYNYTHPNAISDGDVKGKGTGSGGHTHVVPSDDKSVTTRYNYGMFDSTRGGGLYDIEGRNGIGGRQFLQTISKYDSEHQYGAHSVDTSANIKDGQYFIK